MRHFSVFASRALVLICALALPFAMTEQGATAARAGASRGMAPSLRGVTGMPDGRRPATLAQRRAQVRRELADSDRIRRLASQHAKMTVRRMTQAEPQAELQAARRDAARREIIAAGGARAARHPLRVAAPRSPKSGTASGVISGMEGSNVLSGPQGLVAWDYSVDSAFEVPPLPGYPLPDVRFPDWAQQSGFFPGETLTFTTAIYNDSTTDQPVHVTWRVDCGATQVGYDLGQNVTAPPVPGLLPGAPPPPAPPGPQGAIVSFTFQVPTLFSQQCQGNNNLGPWPFEVWVDATVTSPGGGDNLGVQVFAGDVTSMGQPVGCPGSPDSAAAPGAHGSCGDPVDTASGQYAATFTDARITGPGYPLAITRSYSSAESAPGPMGPGWSLPWQANLSVQPNGDAVFTAENGDQHYFASNGNGTFTALPGALSVLAAKTSGTTVTGYTLTAPDHHVLAFNASGQLQSVTDATGRGITLGYAGGQVTSLTDAAGDQATLSYTGSLLSKVTLPDGHTIIYGYTTGLLTSVTTPGGSSGLTTTYAYNAAGLLASIQDPDGHYLVRNTYNSSGQVISQQDGTGAASGFSYATLAGGLTEADVTDPNGGITTHIYGGGLLLQAIAPLGGTTSYAYNSFFEQIAVTDPLGNITTMSYDASGHLTSVADPLGNRRRWAYDASGNLASYADANGNATTYAYNSMDEPTSVTSSSGGMTTYAYGSAGNLVSSVDPRGNVSGANPADYTTTYGYDSNGRLTSVTSPDGAKTSLTYDAEGYLASAADPLGRVTSYAYDAGHRLTKVTAPDGGVTAYGFDGAGNLTSRTDPDGRIWTYAYDAGNRLSTATDPLGNISAYTYDGNGNQVTFTDARGIMSTTSYDANGRPAKVTYSDGTPAVSYAYNGDGDATGVTDGTGTRTLSYDSGGQLVKVAGPGTGSFAYGYDPAGNVTSRAYPDGKVASYTYTAGGQVGSITSGAATITYSYDAAGNLVSAAEPGGVTESRGYNNNGQLTGISYAKGATVLDSYGLTLNAAGQPSQVAVVQDGTSRPAQYYSYDTAGRLASACVSSAGSAACSSASAGTATGTAPNPAAPGAPNGMVTSGIAGKCLDDSNGGTANGNKVDIYSCNGGTSTQLWTIESNGTIQIGGKCLDVHSSGTANGTLVDSYGCNGTGAQQWKAAASQGLQNPESGKCLDDPSGSTTNGTQLDINSCSSTAAQRWQRPYNGLAYAGELTSGVSGKCLDNSGAGTSNGNQVDIVSCDGGTGSQLWTVRDDGTVRIQNKCLDVKSSSTANGTLVDLYGCNGTGAQQWVPAPFGYLINPHSGKCLDDPSSSTTNGTQLDIFTCNGASGQKWTLPSTTVPAVPTSVSVTAGAAAATLSWTPPASTGGVPLTGYTVTASPGGATASAGPYATSATVAGLTPGTAYTFTVTAASTIGSATTAASTAVTPANETAWTYDHAANMLTQTADGITTSDSYNGDEELTKAVTGTSTTAYSYDSAGHQTAAGSIAYSWNGAGYLSRAVTPAGTFTYSYDASGDLSATNLNGTLLQGVTWDINGPLPRAVTDTTTAGSPAADYLYGPGGPALMTTPAGTYSPARDWLGSITGLVSSAGMQVTSTTYSAYGTPSTTDLSSPAPTSSLGYAGSYALPGGTGLSDMRARDYNPATGAFTSLDPMVTVSGQPYAYASDVPDYYADPSGRIVIVDNLVAGAIGAIVGAGATLVNDMIYGKKINWADVGISLASGFAYGAAADECGICAGAASAAVGNTLTQLNDGGWSFSHFDFSQLMAETGQGALMGSFDDYMGSGGGEHVAENASEAARAGLWTFGPDLTVGSTDPAGALLSATSPPAPTLGVACG